MYENFTTVPPKAPADVYTLRSSYEDKDVILDVTTGNTTVWHNVSWFSANENFTTVPPEATADVYTLRSSYEDKDVTLDVTTENATVWPNVSWFSANPVAEVTTNASEELVDPMSPGLIVGFVLVAVFVLLSNGLVIVSFLKFRFLQTTTNVFVCGLAAVDITMSVTVVLKIVKQMVPSTFTTLPTCVLPLMFSSAKALCTLCLILAVAMERYLGTFRPLLYEAWVTPSRVKMVLVFSIVYPVLLTGTTLGASHQWEPGVPCLFIYICSLSGMAVINTHGFFTLAAVIVIYIKIFRAALKHKKAIAPLSSAQGESAENRLIRLSLNLIKKFTIIVGLFVVCWLPFGVVTLVIASDREYYMAQVSVMSMYNISLMILSGNSFVNPIVYALKFDNFRKAFKLLVMFRSNSSVAASAEE